MAEDAVTISRPTRDQRRTQILGAAIDCVLREGFHGASMSEIAVAASMSVGVIYRHFPSKEAIIEAIVERNIADLRSHIAPSRTQTREATIRSMSKKIEKFIARQYERRRCALTLEIYAEAARNPKVETIVQKYAEIERELARNLVLKFASPALEGKALSARIDLLRIIADGLFVHGLYAGVKGSRKAIVEETCRAFALILAAE